jgi:hypothetical protein
LQPLDIVRTIRWPRHVVVAFLALSLAPAPASWAQTASKAAAPEGLFDEPPISARAAGLAEKWTADKKKKDGFFVETGHMITGSGWVSAGPGYRRHLFHDRLVATTSAAVSWRLYNIVRGSLDVEATEDSPWTFGVGALYQDALQINFFGLGNESTDASRTGYRLTSFDVDGHAAYVRGPVTLQGRIGWLPSIDVRSMAGRLPAYPDSLEVFTERTAPGINRQPAFVHSDASITWDGRDRPGRPTRGGAYTASYTRYEDLDSGTFSFHSAQLEATQYVPLAGSRWVAAFRGWSAFTGTSDGHLVPYYLMPNIGGKSTVRGFPDYRFYGPQMLTLSAESRVALFTHVDAAVFVDAGRVADRVEQLGISGLHRAVGAGVRFHTLDNTVARLDVARSVEGWYVIFKLTEPFKRKTFSGNLTPTIPFVP